MKSIPFDESPSEPTPNQLRTMSSSAVVAPASTVIVVCLSGAVVSPVPGLNVSVNFCGVAATLAMRMSLRQSELSPARWPTEGMTSAFAPSCGSAVGFTGVVRFTETGTDVDDVPSVPKREIVLLPKITITVPIHVPFGSDDGSIVIVRSMPCGPMSPEVGKSEIQGRSAEARNDVVPPGRPGMWIWNVIGVVLPAGALTLGPSAVGAGGGMTTTLIVGEKGLASPHADLARTR